MHRGSYSKKTIAVYDIVGSYFVDVFYNDLYARALETHRSGKAKSATDAYRMLIGTYAYAVGNNGEAYKQVVGKLADYYRHHSNFASIIFHEFQDKLLSQFIPSEYYSDFSEQLKDRTLNTVVVRIVRDFSNYLISPTMLRCIIDSHEDEGNVHNLQDKLIEIMIEIREEYYSRFAEKLIQDRQTVPKSVLVQMKKALVNETRARCDAEGERDRCINIISQLIDTNNKLRAQLAEAKPRSDDYRPQQSSSRQPIGYDERPPMRREVDPRSGPSQRRDAQAGPSDSRYGGTLDHHDSRSDSNRDSAGHQSMWPKQTEVRPIDRVGSQRVSYSDLLSLGGTSQRPHDRQQDRPQERSFDRTREGSRADVDQRHQMSNASADTYDYRESHTGDLPDTDSYIADVVADLGMAADGSRVGREMPNHYGSNAPATDAPEDTLSGSLDDSNDVTSLLMSLDDDPGFG